MANLPRQRNLSPMLLSTSATICMIGLMSAFKHFYFFTTINLPKLSVVFIYKKPSTGSIFSLSSPSVGRPDEYHSSWPISHSCSFPPCMPTTLSCYAPECWCRCQSCWQVSQGVDIVGFAAYRDSEGKLCTFEYVAPFLHNSLYFLKLTFIQLLL